MSAPVSGESLRVAILGGGQLARMLAIAAHRLGIDPWVVDPKPNAPAAPVAHHVLGALDDEASLEAIAHCDVATAELDHAPLAALEALSKKMPVRPGVRAFAVAGDRLREKELCRSLGIATARFARVARVDDIPDAADEIGFPAILKARCEGYDGKGQRRVESIASAVRAFRELGSRPALLETVVPFAREISVLAVRGIDGEVRFWNPVENLHREGVLRFSRPLDLAPDDAIVRAGQRAVTALMESLDYVGVLTVEFFEVEGRLLVNEMACRVHNSGHWTEEGAATGQFENHLRAVVGWPLGETRLIGASAMINLVGEIPQRQALLSLPGARVHLYGKEAAPGRKLGHITLRASDARALDAALAAAGLDVLDEAASLRITS